MLQDQQVTSKLLLSRAWNDVILFVEDDWVVLGGQETAGHQDLRSQPESASSSVTAYSQEQDTTQIPAPALPPTTRSVFIFKK